MKQLKVFCSDCKKQFSKSNFDRHFCSINYIDQINSIRDLYDKGIAVKQIKQQYPQNVIKFALRGYRRSRSEASRLAHVRDVESFKCTDEKRKLISEKMKLAHKEGRNLG